MFDKNSAISFSTFYMLELFQRALQEGIGKIPQEQYEMLEELSGFVSGKDDVLPWLEQLAQYAGTNELSIFLFDLSERLNSYPSEKSIEALSTLVEDFINLFTLMMEEKESVRDLGSVLNYFRAQVPLDESVAKADEPEAMRKEKISFEAFFQREFNRLLEGSIEELPADQRIEYRRVIESLKTMEPEGQTYHPLLLSTAESIEKLLQNPNSAGLASMENTIGQLLERVEELQTTENDLYKQIVSSGTIPVVPKEPESPLTVDSLLRDYFLSELDDHANSVEISLSEKEREAAFEGMLRTFKSLKEVSMIHGYSGIEYFSEQMLFTIASAYDKKAPLSEQSRTMIKNLMNEASRFVHEEGKEQTEKFKEGLAALAASFSGVDTEKKDEIAFADMEKMGPVLLDVLQKIWKKIRIAQRTIEHRESQIKIDELLLQTVGACALLFPDSREALYKPMSRFYTEVVQKEPKQIAEELEKMDQVWQHVLHSDNIQRDYYDLLNVLNDAVDNVTPGAFALSDEEEVRRALTETMQPALLFVMPHFKAALGAGSEESKKILQNYLRRLELNTRLLAYESYRQVIDYFRSLFDEKNNLNDEMIEEVQKSLELTFDRLLSAGAEADYSDILEILTEVLTEEADAHADEATGAEEIPAEEAETAGYEEDELEQDFIRESEEQLALVREALERLKKDTNSRQPLKAVEDGIHAVRSSAHLLNKDKTAEFAVNIEEAAEMFEPLEAAIPDDFFPVFEKALTQLDLLVHGQPADTTAVEQEIDKLLNSLIMEQVPDDMQLKEESAAESEQEEEEKPLFAEGEDFDDELLDIFREESENFIAVLTESNAKLKTDLKDTQALNDLEYAAHSLRSAAKMLSFREISQMTAGLEEICESIKNNEIENSMDLQNSIGKAVEIIRRLRDGEKISASELAGAVNLLDISNQKEEPPLEKAGGEKSAPDSEYMRNIFISEAGELIDLLNRDLLELERMPESATLLTEILRNLHTLKGSALMVEYTKIGGLTHKLEDYFQAYKEQNGEVKQEMLPPVFTTLDLIQEMVQSVGEGKGEIADQYTSRSAEIDNKLFFYQNFDMDSSSVTTKAEPGPEIKPTPGRHKKDDNVIKINTDYLDNLVNMATELLVNRTELSSNFDNFKDLVNSIEDGKKQIHKAQNYLEDLAEDDGFETQQSAEEDFDEKDEARTFKSISVDFKKVSQAIDTVSSQLNKLSHGFEKNIQQISNLSKTLHKDILRVRMVPVEYLLDRFPRPIRDLARAQGKRVTVSVEGNNTEMDRAVVEALADPIMHILRNAVDHGIETGDQRKKINKPKTGKITLRARQEKSQVVIDISDDGRGIDLAKVKRKAVQRGLVSKEKVKKLNETEILDFIFYSEFSTRDKTTETSGRGVGLDVVANHIQKLKGVIRIWTEKNVGTTFSIRVPLTLIISQALMTRMHGHSIAIPMVAVQESMELDSKEILVDDQRRYIQAHGKLLPFITVDEILKFPEKETEEKEKIQVLILHDAGISVALGIGKITGRQEIVIKSLGSSLQNVEFIAGGTILGDGEVALILDYAAVVRMVEFQFFGNIRESRPGMARNKARTPANKMELQTKTETSRIDNPLDKKSITDRKPRILIVDDSNSVRSFVSSVLEKHGFITLKANNGKEALELLEKDLPDLMITDLEMPVMDGFKLIEQTRKQPEMAGLPIVILTGRTGKAQRDKGTRLGANSFIGKPFKEGDLMKVIKDFIEV